MFCLIVLLRVNWFTGDVSLHVSFLIKLFGCLRLCKRTIESLFLCFSSLFSVAQLWNYTKTIIRLRLGEYCRNNPLDFVSGIIRQYSPRLRRIIVKYNEVTVFALSKSNALLTWCHIFFMIKIVSSINHFNYMLRRIRWNEITHLPLLRLLTMSFLRQGKIFPTHLFRFLLFSWHCCRWLTSDLSNGFEYWRQSNTSMGELKVNDAVIFKRWLDDWNACARASLSARPCPQRPDNSREE